MAKKRVSLTLEEDLVEKIDHKADKEDIDNRSRAVESFLDDYLSSRSIDTAVILCGGGKNECMIKINGKTVVRHIIEHLDEYNVDRAVVAVEKDDEEVKRYINEEIDADIAIEFFEEDEPLGTAGCIREIEGLNDTFLLMNGDVLCRADIDDMVRNHRDSKALSTMALTTLEDVSPYGVARLKGDQIIGFTEKPGSGEASSKLVNAGVYLIEPDVIDMLPSKDEKKKVYVEGIFEELAEQGLLKGYIYEGDWHDVG